MEIGRRLDAGKLSTVEVGEELEDLMECWAIRLSGFYVLWVSRIRRRSDGQRRGQSMGHRKR